MKQRIITITLAAVLSAFCTFGQTFSSGSSISRLLRGMDRKEGNKVGLSRSEGKPMVRSYVENLDIHTADRWTADTVYFEEVERRTSWIVGKSEPLSKQSLRLGKTYFMLTRKNSTGHYLRVELTDTLGTTPPVMQNLFAGISEKYDLYYPDELAGWTERNSKIHRIDFLPSNDGSGICGETAYMHDGTTVHQMQHEQISDTQAVVSYLINADDSGYVQVVNLARPYYYIPPTYLLVSYGKNGEYSSISPIDGQGWPIAKK